MCLTFSNFRFFSNCRCDHRKNLVIYQKQQKIDEVFYDKSKNNLLKKSENQSGKRCLRSLARKKSAAISSVSQHNNNRKKQKVLYFNTDRSTKVCFQIRVFLWMPNLLYNLTQDVCIFKHHFALEWNFFVHRFSFIWIANLTRFLSKIGLQ